MQKSIAELEIRRLAYQNHLEISVLEKANFIVEVGALTVGLDSANHTIMENVLYPTQYTQKAVNEILEMKFKDGNGKEVAPKVFTWREWYRAKLNEIEAVIDLLTVNESPQ